MPHGMCTLLQRLLSDTGTSTTALQGELSSGMVRQEAASSQADRPYATQARRQEAHLALSLLFIILASVKLEAGAAKATAVHMGGASLALSHEGTAELLQILGHRRPRLLQSLDQVGGKALLIWADEGDGSAFVPSTACRDIVTLSLTMPAELGRMRFARPE